MKLFKGVFPPVITIFDQSGEVDNAAVVRHIECLIDKGVDGIVLFGTTSEFCSISLAEKKELLSQVVSKISGKTKILAGIGDTCISNTFELMSHGEQLGIDGFLAINPYYLVYSEGMVEAYYDKIACSTALPIILYNFPVLSGYSLMPDLVLRLALKHKNIVGIKDTISDFEHVRSMIEIKKSRNDFVVYCAFESQILSAFVCGAEGIISATGNFAPELAVNFVRAYKEGNLENAHSWFLKLCTAMEVYQYETPLILPCKEAAYQRFGIQNNGERLPSTSLSKEVKDKVTSTLKELKLV